MKIIETETMKKYRYLIVFMSSLLLEICSTYYIRSVAEQQITKMIFFAMIGPWIVLPFSVFLIESKTWFERIKYTLWLSIGYGTGTTIVILTGI